MAFAAGGRRRSDVANLRVENLIDEEPVRTDPAARDSTPASPSSRPHLLSGFAILHQFIGNLLAITPGGGNTEVSPFLSRLPMIGTFLGWHDSIRGGGFSQSP
jgi:hypothetical protein